MAKTPRISTEQRRWQAEDDLRTLTRAREIEASKPRMTQVQKIAAAQVKTLSSVAGAAKKAPAKRK